MSSVSSHSSESIFSRKDEPIKVGRDVSDAIISIDIGRIKLREDREFSGFLTYACQLANDLSLETYLDFLLNLLNLLHNASYLYSRSNSPSRLRENLARAGTNGLIRTKALRILRNRV